MQNYSFFLLMKRCILQDVGTLPRFLWQQAERPRRPQEAVRSLGPGAQLLAGPVVPGGDKGINSEDKTSLSMDDV